MSHSHHQKGTQVNHTTPVARTPSLRTGIFAALRGVLGGFKGTRAVSAPRAALAVVAALMAVFAVAASPALAATPPTQTINAPTEVTVSTAHVSGTVNPNAGGVAIPVFFEYKEPSATSWGAIFAGEVTEAEAAGNSPIPFAGEVTELKPGTEYEVRLTTVFEGAELFSPEPNPTFTTPTGPPLIESSYASGVSINAARLAAVINPQGAETTYHFEYTTDPSSFVSATKAPIPEAIIPAAFATGTGTVTRNSKVVSQLTTASGTFEVGRTLTGSGIPPETTIISRTVNSLTLSNNAVGSGVGDILTTAGPQLVSFPLIGLDPATTYYFRILATNEKSPSGGTVGPTRTFTTLPESPTAVDSCPNAAFRQGLGANLPDCRSYVQVSPVDKNGGAAIGRPAIVEASPNGARISYASLDGFPGVPGLPEYPTYLASLAAGAWSSQGLLPPGHPREVAIKGYSPDLRYLILETDGVLAPGAGSGNNFYLYDSVAHTYTVIGDREAGEESQEPIYIADAKQGCSCFLLETLRKLLPSATPGVTNLYTYSWSTHQLTLVDQEHRPAGVGAGPARGARTDQYTENTLSEDGSRVTFTDKATGQIFQRIDGTSTISVSGPEIGAPVQPPEAPAATWRAETPEGRYVFFTSEARLTADATATAGHPDLYRFDAFAGHLEDLTIQAPEGADVLGTLGASADGSYVYFVAEGVLAGGAHPGTCGSTGGTCNLYVWHNNTIRLIAALGAEDLEDWSSEANRTIPHGSRVASSGSDVLFMSKRPLTGYDNRGNKELFHYDYPTQSLVCVSCNPTGSPARSASSGASLEFAGDQNGPNGKLTTLTRNLSSDGSMVFFSTAEPLVPADVNGRVDAYEWRQEGAGGSLHLISTGHSNEDSYFGDATPDGSDVFFFTAQSLVGQDTDQISDLYDAQIGGGLAYQLSPPQLTPCQGESCRAPASGPPATAAPTSASFAGPSNELNCPKGKVKQKGKCVKRKKAKHTKKHKAKKRHARSNRRAGK